MICYGNNCNSGSIHRNAQPEAEPRDHSQDRPRKLHEKHMSRKLRIDGRLFQSVKQASDSTGIPYTRLWRAVENAKDSVDGHKLEILT